MRWSRIWFVLLVVCLFASGSPAYADGDKPAEDSAKPAAASAVPAKTAAASAKPAATEEEVEALRQEVAELKATIQKLIDANGQPGARVSRLSEAGAAQPADATAPTEVAAGASPADAPHPSDIAQKKGGPTPGLAGWNGEHFYLRSPDGQFQLQPVGYLFTNYVAYHGDGSPPNGFAVRSARLGFQGNYGDHIDFSMLAEMANSSSSGIVIRDAYINVKPWKEFQVQLGQFKEPFSQGIQTADTNIEFVGRGSISILYPAATASFRSPGVAIHGDLFRGVMQYWLGAFNGKGLLANATTNQPEIVGRLRFYPWKNGQTEWMKGIAIGGSTAYGRSVGINNELSISGTLNDGAYNYFPSLRINGPIERYNGEFSWISGPWGFRTEYDQLNQFRNNIGSETADGGGFQSVPGVVSKGTETQLTYFLTGDRELENGPPNVRHPVIGPTSPGGEGGARGWGAWELKFRYTYLQSKALGGNFPSNFTPTFVPTYSDHTAQWTAGINWYLNHWVLYKFDFDVDQLKNPSVAGILPQNYFVWLQQLQFRF